jgi:hypothetical protein
MDQELTELVWSLSNVVLLWLSLLFWRNLRLNSHVFIGSRDVYGFTCDIPT